MATVASPSSNKQIVEQIIDFENNGRKVGLFFDLTKRVSIPDSASSNQINQSIQESSVYKQILEAFRGKKQQPIFYVKIRDPSNVKQFTVVVKKGEDKPFSQKYESSKEFARKPVSTPLPKSSSTPNIVDMPKYVIVDNAGGGNCFFEAIFYSLYYQQRDVKQFLNTIYQYIAIWGVPAVINDVATTATYGSQVPYLQNLTTFSAEVNSKINITTLNKIDKSKNTHQGNNGSNGANAKNFTEILRNLIRLAILSADEPNGFLPEVDEIVFQLYSFIQVTKNQITFQTFLEDEPYLKNTSGTPNTDWATYLAYLKTKITTPSLSDFQIFKRFISNRIVVSGVWVGEALTEIVKTLISNSFQNVELILVSEATKNTRQRLERITKQNCQNILLSYVPLTHYKSIICKEENSDPLLVNEDFFIQYILDPESIGFYGSANIPPSKIGRTISLLSDVQTYFKTYSDHFIITIPLKEFIEKTFIIKSGASAAIDQRNEIVIEITKSINKVIANGYLELTKKNKEMISNYIKILNILNNASSNADYLNVGNYLNTLAMKAETDYIKNVEIFVLNIFINHLYNVSEYINAP